MDTQLTVWHERNVMGHYEYNSSDGKSTSGKTALKDMLGYAKAKSYTSVLVIKGRKEIKYLTNQVNTAT